MGQYTFYGLSGFSTLSRKGYIKYNNDKRIITRMNDVESKASSQKQSPFSILSDVLFKPSNQKLETKQILEYPQQIILVDSVLCVTRLVVNKSNKNNDKMIKNYFSVWRKVPN